MVPGGVVNAVVGRVGSAGLGDVAAAGASGTDSCAIAAQGNIAASAIIARRIGITEELFMSYLLGKNP